MESAFQAPTCRSLGLALEARLRNTARRLGSGELQTAQSNLNVDLRVYLRGRRVLYEPKFGAIAIDGTLAVHDTDLLQRVDGVPEGEDELLLVARVSGGHGKGYFPQEHQLSYTSTVNGSQTHILYDQQPLRTDGARPAPIVFLMPKVWISEDVNTYVLVSNVSNNEDVAQQAEAVEFSLLDESGRAVCEWEHRFFYNEARAFDLKSRITQRSGILSTPRFFNLIGRGGSSSFVLFVVMRNMRTQHFAIEHSLPPMYYLDGDMRRVRSEACNRAVIAAKRP